MSYVLLDGSVAPCMLKKKSCLKTKVILGGKILALAGGKLPLLVNFGTEKKIENPLR
jgi:hypothetical protein